MAGPDDGLRALFRKHVKGAHWQTIEGLLDRGVPDCNVCIDSVDVWVECKFTKAWSVRMRPEQVGWLLTRERHGGRTVIAVRQRRAGQDTLWLIAGWQAALMQEKGLLPWQNDTTDGLLGCWLGGPQRWNWNAVRGALIRGGRR